MSDYPIVWLQNVTDEMFDEQEKLSEKEKCEDNVDCFKGRWGLLYPVLVAMRLELKKSNRTDPMNVDDIMSAVIEYYGGNVKLLEGRHKYYPLDCLVELGLVDKHRIGGRVFYSITELGCRCAVCTVQNNHWIAR